MAEAVNSKFERNFILNTGEKIIGEHNEWW
jgi:hypothetical protein